jgi:hypothetical protein
VIIISSEEHLDNFIKYLSLLGSTIGLVPNLLQNSMDHLFKNRNCQSLFSSPKIPNSKLQSLLVKCIIPGILLVPQNESLWKDLFLLFQQFEVKTRYSIYEDFFQNGMLGDSWSRYQCAKDLIEIKKYFKNMIDKKVKSRF